MNKNERKKYIIERRKKLANLKHPNEEIVEKEQNDEDVVKNMWEKYLGEPIEEKDWQETPPPWRPLFDHEPFPNPYSEHDMSSMF